MPLGEVTVVAGASSESHDTDHPTQAFHWRYNFLTLSQFGQSAKIIILEKLEFDNIVWQIALPCPQLMRNTKGQTNEATALGNQLLPALLVL